VRILEAFPRAIVLVLDGSLTGMSVVMMVMTALPLVPRRRSRSRVIQSEGSQRSTGLLLCDLGLLFSKDFRLPLAVGIPGLLEDTE
jgi:hypothetical protein